MYLFAVVAPMVPGMLTTGHVEDQRPKALLIQGTTLLIIAVKAGLSSAAGFLETERDYDLSDYISTTASGNTSPQATYIII